MTALDKLVKQFREELAVDWSPPEDLVRAASDAIRGCGASCILPKDQRRRNLYALINQKFDFNGDGFRAFLDGAATCRVFPNYHEKTELRSCFDQDDRRGFESWLSTRGYASHLRKLFLPIARADTHHRFHEQLAKPMVVRSDARQCDPAERKQAILRSVFGGFVFRCFAERDVHAYMNEDCCTKYYADFYEHLLHFHSNLLRRDCALIFIVVDEHMRARLGSTWRDTLLHCVANSYDRLSNHCYLAVLIKPYREGREDGQWRLFSDLVLYAEKFREECLKTGYFHPEKIEATTKAHIPGLRTEDARFEIANEGFYFKDSYVLPHHSGDVQTTQDPCDLLLLFEKNHRVETPVPCPACRSSSVRGNSYSTLGVKSWECQHPLCPERSAFDRGNRYSLASLIKQQAIKSDADQIPEDSLRRWKLDVVPGADECEVVDMLLRHFSLHGDTALFVETQDYGPTLQGRFINYEKLSKRSDAGRICDAFHQSSFFSRFVLDRPGRSSQRVATVPSGQSGVTVYRGDAFAALAKLEEESIDGAVTSPPYYNARSYSVWPNIYCYLYDMFNIGKEVFRVLRPSAHFVFNIFDYFDNEQILVASAMGKKRMILGPYIINLFSRIGFELQGNTVWFKGEIEGKRNYNQGNRSPYYQLPLNCWEHVLIFRKPGGNQSPKRFPSVLAARPVIKMVRGENVLGHSAPFPTDIPELLLASMKAGSVVLDPFSGSMTTGRAAYARGIRSISIDLHQEYCDLGIKLLKSEIQNARRLF